MDQNFSTELRKKTRKNMNGICLVINSVHLNRYFQFLLINYERCPKLRLNCSKYL